MDIIEQIDILIAKIDRLSQEVKIMIEEEETKKPEATNPEFLRHDIKI
jgi:hypothetical protein